MRINLFSSLSGALSQEKVLDIISNNLANMSTAGFKEERVTFKVLEPEPHKHYTDPLPPANYKVPFDEVLPLRGNDLSYVGVSGVVRDDLQGSPIETKNPTDVMLEGKGYFTINTHQGLRLTRNGSFTVGSEGQLMDKLGHAVLGEGGSIFLGHGKVEINPRGEIYQNGQYIDRLLIKTVSDPKSLEKVGSNHYLYKGEDSGLRDLEFPTVRQYFIEASNVNAVKNITNMILAHRSHEAYQQALKNMDTMMEVSSNSIGEIVG